MVGDTNKIEKKMTIDIDKIRSSGNIAQVALPTKVQDIVKK